MFIEIVILILSLVALIWSADKFVFGAAAIARNFGIAPIIIGLTIVAMGSSAPEMLVAATASMNDAPNTAIGNVIGSNITNIALVLGLTAIFKPLMVSSATIKREMPLLLLVTIVASWMLYDLNLTFVEGLVLIIAFGVFIISLLLITLKQSKNPNISDPMLIEAEADIPENVATAVATFWLI
ncbi:MAG: calcium/sodium antiporter, partial [Thalassotalea sp.]|nr:calcium/sodium antiporter [Thalassotalea sp.]